MANLDERIVFEPTGFDYVNPKVCLCWLNEALVGEHVGLYWHKSTFEY